MLSIVGVLSTSANLGGAELRPLVYQNTIDKNSAISKWSVLFYGLSLLPSNEVGTAFANEIMSLIPADDRCRKFADYIVDHCLDSRCDFAPDLTYGHQVLNRVRQQPMQLSHSMQTIRAASFTSWATFGALDIAL